MGRGTWTPPHPAPTGATDGAEAKTVMDGVQEEHERGEQWHGGVGLRSLSNEAVEVEGRAVVEERR
jgi:hypothetical protein